MEANMTHGRLRHLKTLWSGGFERNTGRLVEICTDRQVCSFSRAIIQRVNKDGGARGAAANKSITFSAMGVRRNLAPRLPAEVIHEAAKLAREI